MAEIETVRHVVCHGISEIEVGETKRGLTKLYEAYVRVQHPGNVAASRIRTEHEAAHPGAIAKLRSVHPRFNIGRIHVIIPAPQSSQVMKIAV